MNCANCDVDLNGTNRFYINFEDKTRYYCCKECGHYDARQRLLPRLQFFLEKYEEFKKKDCDDYQEIKTIVDRFSAFGIMSELQFNIIQQKVYSALGDSETVQTLMEATQTLEKKNSFVDLNARLAYAQLHVRVTTLEVKTMKLIMERKQTLVRLFKEKIAEGYVDLLELCPNDHYTSIVAGEMKSWQLILGAAQYFVEF
jgi:hypothetical protein